MTTATHPRRRRLVVAAAILAAFLAPASVAHAFWSTTATGTLTVTTRTPGPPPAAPTNLRCTSMDSGDDEADFAWSAASGATSYNLYQQDGSSWTLKRTGLTGTSVNNITRNEGPGPNSDLQVLVLRAVNEDGESGDSNQVSVDYGSSGSCGPPPRPSNFRCGSGVSGTPPGHTVRWSAVSGATGYRIYRRGSSGILIQDSIPANATEWTLYRNQFSGDTDIVIRAVRGSFESSSSSDYVTMDLSGSTGFDCQAPEDDD